jgi:hypothetical protein
MTSPEGLKRLRAFLKDAPNLTVVVATEADDESPEAIQRLVLHEKVASDFRKTAISCLPDENGGVVVRAYDPGYKPEPHELLMLPVESIPAAAEVLERLKNVGSTPMFEGEDHVVDGLQYYGIVAQSTDGKKSAVFFRHYSAKKELSRHAAYALMLRKGAYNYVTEKVFLFDDEVDCFSWDGVLYIRNVTQFQRLFQHFAELKAKAEATISAVVKSIPIANVDDFRKACLGNQNMLSKLAAISKKPYIGQIDMAAIKETIKEFTLDITVITAGNREQLVFDNSPAKRWLILRLLDDGYLGSKMTKQRYEVNSKIPV